MRCWSIRYWNMDQNIIQLIAVNLKNLKKLSIATHIDELEECVMDHNICQDVTNSTLQQLHVKLCLRASIKESIEPEQFLSQLFSLFVGIDTFSFVDTYEIHAYELEWEQLLYELIRNKRIYSIKCNKSVAAIQSLKFQNVLYDDAENILKTLINFRNERSYFVELKHLGIELHKRWLYNMDATKTLLEDCLIPFMSSFNGIQSIQLKFGSCMSELYFEPILNVLSNLPNSLISLELNAPTYLEKNYVIKEIESIKLVKKLCELLSIKNNSNLQSIVLDKLELSTKANEFLMFMFGYNNKLCVKDNKYYLCFV